MMLKNLVSFAQSLFEDRNANLDREFEVGQSIAQAYIQRNNDLAWEREEDWRKKFVVWIQEEFKLSFEEAKALVDRSRERGLEVSQARADFHYKRVNNIFASREEEDIAQIDLRKKYPRSHPCGAMGTRGYIYAMDREVKTFIDEDGYLCCDWLDD